MNFDHSRRLLFGALLISLLLHLLVLFGWGWARPLPLSLAQPVMQVIVSAKPVMQPAAPSSPAFPEKILPDVAKRKALPQRESPLVVPQALPTAVAPAAVVGPLLPETAAPASPAASVKAQTESDGISADSLRQYRIELAAAARRFRLYPALARMRGWEGVAEVSISVHTGVPLPSVKLVKSSGHGVLDEQALEMLSRAVAATPLPDSLQGRSFVVPMPIRFSLAE